MANSHLVVDGSNIATEGRTVPSLAQLDEAVRDFVQEHHFDNLVVVVDATFAHRIDASERDQYEEAVLNGELLTPPAGAVGRGDAFVLQIAERSGATVLSNDSFQEFHATYDWLFTEGRLWGGKPVPGVGWVFVARVPVRGPVSRRATREAKASKSTSPNEEATTSSPSSKSRSRKSAQSPDEKAASETDGASSERTSSGRASARRGSSGRGSGGKSDAKSQNVASDGSISDGDKSKSRSNSGSKASSTSKAAASSTARDKSNGSDKTTARDKSNGSDKSEGKNRSSSRSRSKSSAPINTPVNFLNFVTSHPLGSTATATVIEFSSHGAYVDVDGARCYVSLKSMGDPAPRSAREVLAMGEVRPFIVQGFDTPRRGIDLALPGFEQFEADSASTMSRSGSSDPDRDDAEDTNPTFLLREPAEEAAVVAKKKAPAKKAAAKKTAAKKAPAKKVAAKKAPAKASATKAAAKKTVAKKVTAKKAPAKKTVAKKTVAKKTTATKAPAKKTSATKTAAKKAPAKKTVAKKTAAKKAPAKKAPAKASATKTAAKKAPAKKTVAKKTTAKKAPAKKR